MTEIFTLWHSTHAEFDRFEPQIGGDAGFHFGTLAQALMRGGSRLIQAEITLEHVARHKDKGSWPKALVARSRSAGIDGIIYLNRYEGIPTKRILELDSKGALASLDALPDAEFKRLVPEAEESLLAFNASSIRILQITGRERLLKRISTPKSTPRDATAAA